MAVAGQPPGAIEVISLTVAGHAFCIDIFAVREIRGWAAATPLPQAPDYVIGVINLRGTVMPVLDLGARLGLGATDVTSRHVTVVIQRDDDLVGLVVDEVQETIIIQSDELQPPPHYAATEEVFVDALIPRGGQILGRLRVEALLPPDAVQIAA
ncbi:MAG TPA: chemotaxis protein CheW [Phenylobacterium sp.]|nr:chemotaxis protein CheW [Phenylobacterium sp.]